MKYKTLIYYKKTKHVVIILYYTVFENYFIPSQYDF
jgi:hypothetical protein